MKRVTSFFLLAFIVVSIQRTVAQDIPRTMYVLNALARTLSKMNMDSGEITNDILILGDIPSRICPLNDKIYVVNSIPPEVMVIDGRTESVEGRIPLPEGSNPWDIAFTGAHEAYVSHYVANTISVVDFDSETVVESIDVGEGPEGLVVVGNTAYVANTGGWPDYDPSTVSIINILSNTVTKTLSVARNPQELAVAPDGRIHVLCSGVWGGDGGKVYVIDPYGDVDWTPAVADSVILGGFPGDIAITSEGIGYASDWGDESNGFLYSYNVSTGEVFHDSSAPIRVGKGAMRLLWDSKSGNLYVSNFADDTVQRLDPSTGAVLQTYGFGDGAQDMAIRESILETDPWADEVVSFTPGKEWSRFGENFFPENVLGPPDPDPAITLYSPSSKPQEILSLGHGGEIVLEFSDNVIVDGEGVDFTVFENAFYFLGTEDPFIEAGIVSVSLDGIRFVAFPYDTSTFEGFAGVTPVNDNQHPTDPTVSGGDSFDITDLGFPYIRFVKITDAGDIVQEGPFNGDFDLDAVVAIHSLKEPFDGPFKGDVNADSQIDFLDALSVVQIILGEHEPTAAEVLRSDCNGQKCEGDGDINVLDIIKILNISLGRETCP
jgi:YVTN family beta-propeller protein